MANSNLQAKFLQEIKPKQPRFATVKGIEFTNEKYSFTKTTSLRYDLQMMLT